METKTLSTQDLIRELEISVSSVILTNNGKDTGRFEDWVCVTLHTPEELALWTIISEDTLITDEDSDLYYRKRDVCELFLSWLDASVLLLSVGYELVRDEEEYVRKNVSVFSTLRELETEISITGLFHRINARSLFSFPVEELTVDGKAYIAVTIHSPEEEALYNSLYENDIIHVSYSSDSWKYARKSDVGRIIYSPGYFR